MLDIGNTEWNCLIMIMIVNRGIISGIIFVSFNNKYEIVIIKLLYETTLYISNNQKYKNVLKSCQYS